MYLGINFDGGLLDDEPMLISEQITSGSTGDSYSITIEKVYQILKEDIVALTLYQPKKGQTVRIKVPIQTGGGRIDAWAWFQTDSVNVQREGQPIVKDGSTLIHVRVSLNLTMVSVPNEQGYTYPWDLPPYNFKIGTELLEQSAWDFLNTGANTWAEEREPFVNTAGVPLQASVTRPLVRMTFSFNLYDIQPDWVYKWTGKVNNDVVDICGITFQPGMVKLESLGFEVCTDTRPGEEDGEDEEIYYYKCDVSLLIDPQKFERQYLNVGTHIKDANGNIRRLWCAKNGNTIEYGTIDEIIGYENAEEVSENMFLNSTGTGVTGIGADGRQEQTFRTGYLEQTCPFSAEHDGIGLPTAAPFYHNVIDRV